MVQEQHQQRELMKAYNEAKTTREALNKLTEAFNGLREEMAKRDADREVAFAMLARSLIQEVQAMRQDLYNIDKRREQRLGKPKTVNVVRDKDGLAKSYEIH
jgi:hypothetical protein